MTKKEREITKLYQSTALEVAINEEKWVEFLKKASYQYKYRFDEQLLIYAQKPDAIACAETKIWNEKLKRWINKGTKGIALITENDGITGLRFVFDVSDTNSKIYGRKLKLWTLEEKYETDIIETLEDKYGKINNNEDIGTAIIGAICNSVEDNIQDYYEELKETIKGSKLGELDAQMLESTFVQLVMYSMMTLILSRCGIDTKQYFDKTYFEEIKKFNTLETISILGTAIRDLSKEILLEISNTIINVKKREKNQNHTFVKNKQSDYDISIENEKGSVEYENNIQNRKQTKNRKSTSWKIRKNEVTISKDIQEGNVHDASGNRQIDRTLDKHREDSEKENRNNSRAIKDNVWNNRRIKEQESNGMGMSNEQHTVGSRTDNREGDNLYLKEKQAEEGSNNPSFFDEEKYYFNVGDIIYIGTSEFTILEVDKDNIKFYENDFPLNRETVAIKDVIGRIAENPLNDYLKNKRETIKEEKETIDVSFNKWLDTFIEEKGIQLDDTFTIEKDGQIHVFEIGNIVENIKVTTPKEQAEIKDMLVKIDFYNADVLDYFKHLAQALIDNREVIVKDESQKQENNNVYEKSIELSKSKKKNINKNIEYFDLHPEIPNEERNNFKIEDDNLGVGTAKEKYRNNVEAIKVLKLCEEQNRYATLEEQQILSKYVGWGGLKLAFKENEDSWAKEYNELKSLLTDEEYKNARKSSLTAYYTPPVVIKNIYKALQNMGLNKGNILEPSCRYR